MGARQRRHVVGEMRLAGSTVAAGTGHPPRQVETEEGKRQLNGNFGMNGCFISSTATYSADDYTICDLAGRLSSFSKTPAPGTGWAFASELPPLLGLIADSTVVGLTRMHNVARAAPPLPPLLIYSSIFADADGCARGGRWWSGNAALCRREPPRLRRCAS